MFPTAWKSENVRIALKYTLRGLEVWETQDEFLLVDRGTSGASIVYSNVDEGLFTKRIEEILPKLYPDN